MDCLRLLAVTSCKIKQERDTFCTQTLCLQGFSFVPEKHMYVNRSREVLVHLRGNPCLLFTWHELSVAFAAGRGCLPLTVQPEALQIMRIKWSRYDWVYISGTGSLTCCLLGLPYQPEEGWNKREEVNIHYSEYWCSVRREIQHPAIDYHCLCMYIPRLMPCECFTATACVLKQSSLSNPLLLWSVYTESQQLILLILKE